MEKAEEKKLAEETKNRCGLKRTSEQELSLNVLYEVRTALFKLCVQVVAHSVVPI